MLRCDRDTGRADQYRQFSADRIRLAALYYNRQQTDAAQHRESLPWITLRRLIRSSLLIEIQLLVKLPARKRHHAKKYMTSCIAGSIYSWH